MVGKIGALRKLAATTSPLPDVEVEDPAVTRVEPVDVAGDDDPLTTEEFSASLDQISRALKALAPEDLPPNATPEDILLTFQRGLQNTFDLYGFAGILPQLSMIYLEPRGIGVRALARQANIKRSRVQQLISGNGKSPTEGEIEAIRQAIVAFEDRYDKRNPQAAAG
jgi:hypothetical protein